MQLIRKKAYARAGLIGNPSDGYGGKTIAVSVRDFHAEVTLYEWDRIEVVFTELDQSSFDSIDDLLEDVRLHGYYGGVRLVKATIRKFVQYCRRWGFRLHDRTFAVRYGSTIPRQVGLAGSSAIITATLRCLMEFYEIDIPREILPSLALSVEREELGIPAGLQDRVIQAYEGVVFMDFAPEAEQERMGYPCGHYEPLDPTRLPPLYLAYSTQDSEPTEVVHNNLRARFEAGDPKVLDAMKQFADITVAAREAIKSADHQTLAELIDRNFDLRRSICPLPPGQVRMVETARSVGATAKFAGSGGAIIGTYTDFDKLRESLGKIQCEAIRPKILAG